MSVPIILASGSPRRRELMSSLGLEFEVRPAEIDEALHEGEDPFEAAERLARQKATAVGTAAPQGALVVAADTLVVLDGRALSKPADDREAASMLSFLAGRRHAVVTGLALARDGRLVSGREITAVVFTPMTPGEIAAYVATGEPRDKAGAYALQGIGALFVERVEGSPSNVIGLPVARLRSLASELGVDLLRRPEA